MHFPLRSRRPGRAALAVLVAAAAGLVATAPAASATDPAEPATHPPAPACEDIAPSLPDTTVLSAAVQEATAETPAFCRVEAVVDHPPAGNPVTVWVHLPLPEDWNGRFQGVGGGGFSGGSEARLAGAVGNGYAAAATDAGNPRGSNTDRTDDADFALGEDGELDWEAIENFGHQGIHDMTVTAKAVVAAYYGEQPAYSYFTGCSTGGRQGLMEAQRHPDAYDGILSAAPVTNFPEMQTGQIWGQLVMLEEGNPVPACTFEAALAAAVEACDTVGDGVRDGVIGDPLACDFDLGSLVGTMTDCGEVITAEDVEVMRRIAEGPRTRDGGFLWYGLAPGAPYAGLNDTEVVDGQLVQRPFLYDLWWFTRFLAEDLDFDWTTLTYESFEDWFRLAVERYDEPMGAADPDLSAFAGSGGKLLLWHGAADFGVPFQGTVDYYERVVDEVGKGHAKQFVRLFLAPGVGHCSGGAGPQPVDPLSALVTWVEEGKAPRTLDAATTAEDGTVTQTRPLCAYPFVARWTGRGDASDGSTYRCVPGTRMELPAP